MEILIFGLTRGAVYALVAVGFVLVFSIAGILNLAHGSLVILGAYGTFLAYELLFSSWGAAGVAASLLVSAAAVSLFAASLYRFALRRNGGYASYVMTMTLAVALLLEYALRLRFGITSASVPPVIEGTTELLGVRVSNAELILVPVSAACLSGLWAFLHLTRTGRATRAVAQNPEAAVLVGINLDFISILSITLSAALAALAGSLIAPLVNVTPALWSYWLIKGFAVAILGGLGSLGGAVLAAFLFSFAETAIAFLGSDRYADLAALLIIVVTLALRPGGLMGWQRA